MISVEQALSNLALTRKRAPRELANSNRYRAQWVYYTPDGYRDEPFECAWSFDVPADGNPHKGYPVQLDDDAPFIVRAFYSPSLLGAGFAELYDANAPPNALSSGLVYNFGGWGFGTYTWPMEQEFYCRPGSALMLDFQLANVGGTSTIIGSFLGVKRRKEC